MNGRIPVATSAGLSGTGLTLQTLVDAWRRVKNEADAAMPWRRWIGKAELKLDDGPGGGWLPADMPGVCIETSTGCLVVAKPAALAEVKRAWAALGMGLPFDPVPPSNEEIAAMFAWIAEVQAARH
jgi:hypothetical protein